MSLLSLFQKKESFFDGDKDYFLKKIIAQTNQKEIDRLFVRLFATEDGTKVLAYLQYITFQKTLGSNATESDLRYAEGQRALVTTILRLIDRGRQG